MAVQRRDVLVALADHSGADGETTTVGAVAASLGVDEAVAEDHVASLVDCDLATATDDGVRVTITGQQLLALDLDGPVVVDASDSA